MILFLTSSPCDDHVPEGVKLPCIYDVRNAFVEQLQAAVAPQNRCVIVAAYPDAHAHNDEMTETFAGCFAYHDMPLTAMDVLDSRTENRAEALIRQADVVILAGGHVPTQNAWFRRLGLKDLMKSFDGVVIGISAGSMNSAGTVYAQPEEPGESIDPAYQRYLPGLGLTELQILPHYQMVKDNILDGRRLFEDITFEDSIGHTFYVLEDGSYILCKDGQAAVFGQSWTIHDGEMKPLCDPGESVIL